MTNLQQEANELYPYADPEKYSLSQRAYMDYAADNKRAAYLACAEKYTGVIEQKEAEIKRLRTTLQEIAAWQLPETGRYWDSENKEPMSYGACYGSNGERDYIISKALKALE